MNPGPSSERIETTGSSAEKARRGQKSVAKALPPQESLVPIGDLFARMGNTEAFHRLLVEYIRSLVGGMAAFIHQQSDKSVQLVAASMAPGPSQPRISKNIIDQVVIKGLASGNSQRSAVMIDQRDHAVLVVPFHLKDSAPICLSVILPPERIAFADPCFTILHLTTQFLVQRDLFVESKEKATAFHQATLLVEMFSLTNSAATYRQSLFTLANELKEFFQCDRVAIGSGRGKSCRVQTISGASREEKRNLGISQLSHAMREATSLKKILVWPRQKTQHEAVAVSSDQGDLLHSFNAGSILVVPLMEDSGSNGHREEPSFSDRFAKREEVCGALTLIWSKESPPLEKFHVNLVIACQPHLSALVQMLRASKTGLSGGWLGRFLRKKFLRKLAGLALLGALIAAMFFPITYRLGADCRIQPVTRRIVAAPFANQLHKSYVKPGAMVEEGQILAELEGREIRVGLAEAIAARNSALKRRDEAMVGQRAVDLQMAQLEADRLTLEVKRLQFQNEHLLIRSPIDGVILTGDLERSEGVQVTVGDKLFEIAPLDRMLVEIYLPETELGNARKGMKLKLRLESRTGFHWESTLENIHPVSEVHDGKNVFVGEANLTNQDRNLRPGMKGVVRIYSDRKAIGWILFHRLWEYLRLKVW